MIDCFSVKVDDYVIRLGAPPLNHMKRVPAVKVCGFEFYAIRKPLNNEFIIVFPPYSNTGGTGASETDLRLCLYWAIITFKNIYFSYFFLLKK